MKKDKPISAPGLPQLDLRERTGGVAGTFGVHVAKIAAAFKLDSQGPAGLHFARECRRRHRR